jgi:hypothetical protein
LSVPTNQQEHSSTDQNTLVDQASKRYEELWKQGFFKLQGNGNFTPADWEVSRVEVNTQASVYPADTQQFPLDITILVEDK